MMFGPANEPTVAAGFDWEMVTLDDLRADLGWVLS